MEGVQQSRVQQKVKVLGVVALRAQMVEPQESPQNMVVEAVEPQMKPTTVVQVAVLFLVAQVVEVVGEPPIMQAAQAERMAHIPLGQAHQAERLVELMPELPGHRVDMAVGAAVEGEVPMVLAQAGLEEQAEFPQAVAEAQANHKTAQAVAQGEWAD
jgi:hypothetical protein